MTALKDEITWLVSDARVVLHDTPIGTLNHRYSDWYDWYDFLNKHEDEEAADKIMADPTQLASLLCFLRRIKG